MYLLYYWDKFPFSGSKSSWLSPEYKSMLKSILGMKIKREIRYMI